MQPKSVIWRQTILLPEAYLNLAERLLLAYSCPRGNSHTLKLPKAEVQN